jgi:hypothetical protein
MHCSRFRPAGPAARGRLWPTVPALLAAFVIAALAGAQAPTPSDAARAEALALDQKILVSAKEGSEIMANLAYLSDIIGPRLTGSAALKRANEWTAEKMKSYGLANVRLEPWTIPVGWERGPAYARIIEPDNGRTLHIAAMGWTPGTKGRLEADVVALTARNANELAPYKGKLKNAVVLRGPPAVVRPITAAAPPAAGGEGRARGDSRPGEAAKPAADSQPPRRPPFEQSLAFRREMMDFLRQEGAAVMMMDAGKPHGLMTMTGSWRGADRASGPEPMPAVFVCHEHYALLYRLATRPAPARTRIEIEINNRFIPGPITVYNTVGEIPGSEKPDEFVIVGAHLDSWDLAQGTTDNGTGTSVVLETARILARCGVRPKRTIRFVLFSGEEQGLHGSRAYVQQHKDELPRTSAALIHDTGTGRVIGWGLQGRAAVKPLLEAELVSLKEVGFQELSLRGMGGSDHMAFEQAGVPGFAVQQDMTEYRLTHHSQSDTFDKAREADLIQGAQVMAVTAMRLANLPTLLPRDRPPRNPE